MNLQKIISKVQKEVKEHAIVSSEAFTPSCMAAPAGMGKVTGETIKNLRKELGMSQVGFAVRFGIPVATVRSWEQGVNKPRSTAVTLIRMIAASTKGT